MENIDLIESFSLFKDEKSIDKETLMAILEEVFRAALKKKYGADENFDIIINPDKGDLEIWRNRIVVEDESVEDSNQQIALSEARKIQADFEIGEECSEPYKILSLGRRAIQSIGQNLRAKIHEYDSSNLYMLFKDRIGEIHSAELHHIKGKALILLDDEHNEVILPKEKQIPSDYFKKGEQVKGVVESVELKGNKPHILLSRTSPKFLQRLCEQEIPEIADGHIFIDRIARIPGEKAKMAVSTLDTRIDPVGACVGVKGARINGIVKELGGENIDVIQYAQDPAVFIERALAPAQIISVEVREDIKKAIVYVPKEEVSKAIGKGGANIRLASQLTGYELDVFREGLEDEDIELDEFKDEIESWIIDEFKRVGLDTAKSVLELSVSELEKRVDLEEETIEEVLEILREEFEKEEDKEK